MPTRSLSPQTSTCPTHQPPKRRRRLSRSLSPTSLITRINSLPLRTFQSHYLPTSNALLTFTPHSTSSSGPPPHTYTLTLHDSQTLPPADLNACFKLVEFTSRVAYERSSVGWSARRKKAEMREEGMRFLVVRRCPSRHRENREARNKEICTMDRGLEERGDPPLRDRGLEVQVANLDSGGLDGTGNSITATSTDLGEWEDEDSSNSSIYTDDAPIEAFLSFLPTLSTYGHTAIYCYEIHLLPHLRGCGLGRHLMHIFETIGRAIGVEKAMLTVFASNAEALTFYGRLGYDIDEESPRARKLRGERIMRADYLILSKTLL